MSSSSPSSDDHPSKRSKSIHPPPLSSSQSHHTQSVPTPQTPDPANMEDTEVDLFPASTASNANNGPQTPPRNDHLNATAPGELSPPRSQGTMDASASAASNNVNGNDTTSATNGTGGGGGDGGIPPTSNASFDGVSNFNIGDVPQQQREDGKNGGSGHAQPGEWKSKKNQDEMGRAWEYVVDKEWNAKEFGDVIMRGKQMAGMS